MASSTTVHETTSTLPKPDDASQEMPQRTSGVGPAGVRRGFRVARLPRGRLVVLDVLRMAARQPTMHGLLEVDVTAVRHRLGSVEGRPTMTAYVVATLGRALRQCPDLNARRAGRRLVLLDSIDVVVTVERLVDDTVVPVPFVVRNADTRNVMSITSELRALRSSPLDRRRDIAGGSVLAKLPPVVRRQVAILLSGIPRVAAKLGPPIGVSSLGMFGAGWGIPLSPLTVMVTIGGATTRVVLCGERVENHEFLPLTLSFDHSVVDGAPAARFATLFRQLLDSAVVLDEDGGA